jgi:type I restriction enzyme S subunit
MIADLKPYSEYKDSGQDWLGNVPRHWTLAPGHSAFRARKEPNRGLKEKTVLSLSYGRIKVKSTEKQTGLVPESYETYQIVEPGNIIIRGTDLQNDKTSLRIGFARDRGIITSAYLCLAVRESVLPEYGYQLLNTFDLTKAIYRYGSGTRQNLDHGEIKRLPIFLPPPDEQAAIVRFLDHANRKIDGFIRAKRRLIALLNEQKQAIIQRAVTRGIDRDVLFEPSGIKHLPVIPAKWRVIALKHVLRKLIDCEHKTAPRVEASDYRVLRTSAIKQGRIIWAGTYCTTSSAFSEWTARGVPVPGDVAFTREAPAGEASVIPADSKLCMGQRTVLMKPRHDMLLPEFLVYQIYFGPARTEIALATQGSTVGHFNMSDIGAMPMLIPPLGEQKDILDHCRLATNPLIESISRAEREIVLLQECRTRLTADIVTGKLDVREAAARLPELDDAPVDEAIIDEPDESLELEATE